ncbi:hypothetical protein F7725_011475 [Dissostichus mawsoni]|uniref:Kinesin-like protein n=1 Tax=Dissostichus mawsoni TaxID=36200 RepID=A0A7J5Z8Y5_DISMA|nr:hypothetical protein F7725_011475 [Dissostichus mawsoni]
MDTSLSRLLVGLSVKIIRSDGRVHLATVKSADSVKSVVMVEWNERNVCRGKEVDLSELSTLNPELLDHIKNATNNANEPPPPALDKKYEGRLRSSRIPAPFSSPAVPKAEESVANRSQNRQTCMFQVPAPPPDLAPVPTSESTRANLEPVHQDPPPSSVLTQSGPSNRQRRKNEASSAETLSVARQSVKENEPDTMPPLPAVKCRRKSVAHPEINKSSKRQSSVAKPPDGKTKRGKFGEASRPNQKFYEMIQDFRETLEITPLSTTDHIEPHRISVCVRKRPFNKLEITRKEIDVVSIPGKGVLLVHEPKQKVDLTKYLDNQLFHFDYSFNETSTNDLVYKFTAKPLVQSIFDGGMATCFAYGQTGSGKTHTMGGDFTGKQQNSSKGIYALAEGMPTWISLLMSASSRFTMEKTSGQTSANANSSRSHAILQIVLRRNDRATTMHGKFSLVDLAGNERGTDVSSNDRSTLVETAEINRSLLALKECIRSLGMNSDHIPFRMSTLTKVLRDSFIGEKSRTCMIAMVSPGLASCEYTMNTLRYSDRVKELKGNSKANCAVQAQELLESSTEEESVVDTSVYDSISRVAELEEKVYAQVQKANEFYNAMGKSTYNIEEGLPDLVDYAKTFMGMVEALQTAVDEERMARQSL